MSSISPLNLGRRNSGNLHRRGSSHSSSASSPSIGSMSEIMQALSSSPSGSKMAEDAKKAMALAQHRRAPAPTGLHMPPPVREVPSGPTTPVQTPSVPPSRVASPTPSDRMWSRLEANEAQSPGLDFEQDPFEYDAGDAFSQFILEPPGPPQWPDAPPYPPRPALAPVPMERTLASPASIVGWDGQLVSPTSSELSFGGAPTAVNLQRNRSRFVRPRVDHFAGVPDKQNALAIFWRGSAPQTFALVTDPIGASEADETYPIQVEARHTQVVEMPERWSGRVQRVTGLADEPATHCNIEFGGYRGLTFFGVSYAWGNNGPVVIRGSQTGLQSGSPWVAEQTALNDIVMMDHGRTRVIHGTAYGPRPRRLAVAKYYREFLEHPAQGGVELGDEDAVQATRDRHLLLDFY